MGSTLNRFTAQFQLDNALLLDLAMYICLKTNIMPILAAASTRDGDYEPQNRRKRKSDEMTAQSKSAAAAPPKAKRASTAASVKQEQQEPSREQPTKRPIVKQEPKDSSAGVQKKEDAKVGA